MEVQVSLSSSNPFFIGRQAELAHFARLLDAGAPTTVGAPTTADAPLLILNVHGHSGVGKTWLLGALRDACREAQFPFAQLDAYRLGEDLSPTALLMNLADQLALDVAGADDDTLTFDRLLPQFITALADISYPVIALMVDDYDQLFHVVDPWLRNLFLAVQGFDQFTGPPSHRPLVSPEALPRIVTVINSHEPVRERWPPNPLYHRALETLPIADFSFAETCDYLTVRGVDAAHHRQLFRLTQGHPLTLALVASLYEDLDGARALDNACNHLPITPETTGEMMQYVLKWALQGVDTEADDTQGRVKEILRAAAVVRRFDQPLLAAMLDWSRIPDALFDQVTALSMVVARRQLPSGVVETQNLASLQISGHARMFVLHNVLRAALLEDAQQRGEIACLDTYRRRALLCYTQQFSDVTDDGLGERGLDILFLHRDSLVRDMFFGWSAAPLASDRVTYDEMAAVLEPLMRDNFYYQLLGFEGASLERLIDETKIWLALDRELHGDVLHYFRVVRRSGASHESGRGAIAGFILSVPVTAVTLPYLHQETMSAVYETGYGSIAQHVDTTASARAYFSLRVVADGLDSFSALLRTVFVQMSSQSFDVLITVIPWRQLCEVLEAIGFEILARDVVYEGYQYDVLQLDVGRREGPVRWLFRLVREELGLPPHSLLQDWDLFKEVLQEALDSVHDSFKLLAKSPLIDEFALVAPEAEDWARAEALTQALQATLEAMRLPAEYDRPDAAFHTLNERYGLVGQAWQRFEFGGSRPSMDEVAHAIGCSRGTLYNRLVEALEAFARAFRRRNEHV